MKPYRPTLIRNLLPALLLLFVSFTAHKVLAHGEEILLRSEPESNAALVEPPAQVMTWFSEELETSSTMEVFNLAGEKVDNGDGGVDLNDPDHASMIVTLPPLENGVYLVQWKAVLLDSDVVQGAFPFSVGTAVIQPGALPNQPQPAATAVPTAAPDGRTPLPLIGGGVAALLLIGIVGFAIARSRQKA